MGLEKRAASKKVGLALGGGAARGLAHIGVLQVLQEKGIPIDMVAGTSIGAIVGALYAGGIDAGRIKRMFLDISRKRLNPFIDPSLPRSGFIKGNKLKDFLKSNMGGDMKFADLEIPFACVATDIDTGEEVVFHKGPVLEAVRASISLPAIFTVVRCKNRYLSDGGLVNPVPVSVLRQMGADFVIAVNVIPEVSERTRRLGKGQKDNPAEPNIIHVIVQALQIGTYSLVRASLEKADVVIEPEVAHIGAGDLHHAGECIEQGDIAARAAVPEIKRLLSLP